jgi:hypothetical protein
MSADNLEWGNFLVLFRFVSHRCIYEPLFLFTFFAVVKLFEEHYGGTKKQQSLSSGHSPAVAAVKVLTEVIKTSHGSCRYFSSLIFKD